MARRAAEVWGYDISPSMLALARTRAPPNLVLSTDLPEGPFDWINSFIVFQHIPPAEGLALLDACLARCAPQAFLSLQFTFWRDGRQPNPHPLAQFRRSVQRRRAREAGAADDLIRMYDYDLGDIAKRLTAAGFPRLVLRHTCHARHHGAWILARRTL
jgi:SAM-dependent methyltransferase